MDRTYNLESMLVLVVDSNKHMRSIIATILQGFGVQTLKTVADVATAFEHLQTHPCDLVICEYQLRPLDGLEFVRMLRTAKDSRDPLLPILMLTAHTELPRVAAARDAGITEFITKPVKPADLYKRIITIIEHPRQFVRSQKFFGPDRRRAKVSKHDGPDRRNSEKSSRRDREKASQVTVAGK